MKKSQVSGLMSQVSFSDSPHQWYGWNPDRPDRRDKLFALAAPEAVKLPAKVSLRAQMPPIWNQGKLGSCTAHGILACDRFAARKQTGAPVADLSRLMLYWLERRMEGTLASDSGAQIRDGIKCLAKYGSCHEQLWPYDIAQFTVPPPPVAFTDAAEHQALEYQRLPTGSLLAMCQCLAAGFPFTFGFSVYAQFESAQCARDGLVKFPPRLALPLGGHCVTAIGYDGARKMFEVRNSWGADWGDAGHCWMPYSYFTDHGLTSDFWTIRRVEAP